HAVPDWFHLRKHRYEALSTTLKSGKSNKEMRAQVTGNLTNSKKGDKVKLWELFETKRAEFQKEILKLRGKDAVMEHYSENLLWGKGLCRKLRVVLVREVERRFVLFSTDLSVDPTDILSLSLRRSRAEGAFRELKQQIGAFSYRFRSKSVPRPNRFRKKTEPLPLQSVASPKERARIIDYQNGPRRGALRSRFLYRYGHLSDIVR
ncbi:MAG: hypothetical protein IKN96_06020, partial [Oscillibacter sp.]|nr:hypothetical protein [Oscillibacter sp.]